MAAALYGALEAGSWYRAVAQTANGSPAQVEWFYVAMRRLAQPKLVVVALACNNEEGVLGLRLGQDGSFDFRTGPMLSKFLLQGPGAGQRLVSVAKVVVRETRRCLHTVAVEA
jgi:hypothetical protein